MASIKTIPFELRNGLLVQRLLFQKSLDMDLLLLMVRGFEVEGA
jgi:hypothetical protein